MHFIFSVLPEAVPRFLVWFLPALPVCYLAGSIWESYFHELVLDQAILLRFSGYHQSGWLSDPWFARFSHHVVHHHLTFRRSYVRQFSSDQEEREFKAKLARMLDRPQFRSVISSRFGTSFTWSAGLQFGILLGLLAIGILPFCPGRTAKIAIGVAILMGGAPYLVLSKWVHPFLHQRFDQIGLAPAILRPLLRSKFGLAIRVGHFVHHRHPARNYNLQLGFDLLRQRWRAPNAAEWEEMVALGLVTPAQRTRMEGRRVLLHSF